MLGGELLNVSDAAVISDIGSVDHPSRHALIFVDDQKIARDFATRPVEVGLCATTPSLAHLLQHLPLVLVERPKAGFNEVASYLFKEKPFAWTGPAAMIGTGSEIHASVILADGVQIGENAILEPFSVIGPGCVIGDNVTIGSSASVRHCVIGNNVAIGSGCRIGEQGFGLFPKQNKYIRIPHFGSVKIDDDVEIDANCTIDRGVIDDTHIGRGSKLDCMVHIAHNVVLGENCILAAQTGLSGSVNVGSRVVIGGKVGIADHVTIGDDVHIAGGSGIMHNIPSGERWGGYPAKPARKWLKEVVALGKLISKKME